MLCGSRGLLRCLGRGREGSGIAYLTYLPAVTVGAFVQNCDRRASIDVVGTGAVKLRVR